MTKRLGYFIYAISFATIFYIFIKAFPYYITPLPQRPFHPLHTSFKPAGIIGHGLGIIGTLMMIFMLGYSLRKRLRALHRWGRLSTWLNVHIYFGVIGPLLVVLHSSFKLNGIISISFWSMIIVMLSGIVGRYLYLKIPRDFSGEELTLQKVQQEAQQLAHHLQEQYAIEPRRLQLFLGDFHLREMLNRNFLSLWFSLLLFDIQRKRIRHKIRHWLQQEGIPKEKQQQLVQLVWRRLEIEQKLILWNKIHQMFHYWHVFHKPFAIIMYLILVVHVAIAIWLGYTWIL